MTACSTCREAISAGLDGEVPPTGWDAARVAHHLAGCAACTRFQADAVAQHRRWRLAVAPSHADLVGAVMATARRRSRTGFDAVAALAAVGAAQVVVALPALLLAGGSPASAHAVRELGVAGVALGAGMLWVSRRPHLASALLPVAAVLVLGGLLGALVDVWQGTAVVTDEAVHLLDVAGLGLLAHLARRPPTGVVRRPVPGGGPVLGGLRAVPTPDG